mgnify:CR=1 FL=1
MCQWGTDKVINVIRRNNANIPDGWHPIAVDACIADYVQEMNDKGIITIGCCCGHGKGPSHVLVAPQSAYLMQAHGYAFRVYDDYSLWHELPSD